MRAFLLLLDGTVETAQRALGAVVCAGVRTPGGKRLFAKGHVIGESDLASLGKLSGVELPLLALEEGDVDEREAGMRLGSLLAGPGGEAKGTGEARAGR